MIRRDMPQVLAIEEAGFGAPWREDDFINCLRNRNCIGMVYDADLRPDGGNVQGFMVYELHKDRLHLLHLGVGADHRRRGLGRQMVEKLAGKLSEGRRNRITTTVEDGNLEGQLFLSALGFVCDWIFRDHFGEGIDGYSFVRR